MKVLVVSPYAIMSATFETDLEIVQCHLDQKDEVVILGCNSELPACYPNLIHDLSLCMTCISRRRAGFKLLTGPYTFLPLMNLSEDDHREIAQLPDQFANLAELQALKMENFDLGWGVLSTLVSATRDSQPEPARYVDFIRRLVLASAMTFRSVQRHLDEIRPDRIYVFNGRFDMTRAVLRAAQGRNVDCYMQDRGATFRHYLLWKNRLSHEHDFWQDLIRDEWKAGNPETREIMGAAFFVEAADGIRQNCHNLIEGQKANELPPGWDPTKNNIAVYMSSEDEFVAVGDSWKSDLYPGQFEGLDRILASLEGNQGVQLYIRLHPHQARMRESPKVRRLLKLRQSNATVIDAQSPVSSYSLMRHATRVLTFGSTVGVEATYWGKPSILASISFYNQLDVTYNPATHEEVLELLCRPNLPPKNKEGALVYGYFTRVGGLRFRHFQPQGLAGGPFRGVEVRPSMAARVGTRALPFKNGLSSLHAWLLETRLRHGLASGQGS